VKSDFYREVARKAVGFAGWDLLPGMLLVSSDGVLRSRVISVDPYFAAIEGDGQPSLAVGGHPSDIPDFTDAATRGCLVELARRRHGPTTTAIASVDPSTGKVTDWYVGNNMRVICYADDEIEAYARALEIDP
jgi:hypothetical protein